MAVSQRIAQLIDSSLKQELQELTGAINVQQPHREYVAELREIQAGTQGKLQSAETSLAEARLECAVLKTREQENFRQIASLETQVCQVRKESATTSETYLRLRDLETCNKDLAQRSSEARKEASVMSAQLQQKESNIASLDNQLAAIQLQLEEVKAKNANLLEQKLSYEQQITTQQKRMKEELSRAAGLEVEKLKGELANAKSELKQSQADVADLSHTSLGQIERLRSEKTHLEKALAENVGSLQTAQNELHKEVKHVHSPSALMLTLQKRSEKSVMEQEAKKLEKEYRDNVAKQKMKDSEIAALKAALEKENNPPQVTPKRAVVSPCNVNKSVDEDESQVEEIMRDLTDIMNNNYVTWSPKLTQPRSKMMKSKTVTSETMAGLFPSTPGESSNVERNEAKGSTKVSEMRQVEDSQSQERDHDLSEQKLRTIGPYSSVAAPAANGRPTLDDLTARNTASNALRARLTTNVPRKRRPVTADLAGPDEQCGPRKATRSSTRINRRVIADSQSPTRLSSQTLRPPKLTATHNKGNT